MYPVLGSPKDCFLGLGRRDLGCTYLDWSGVDLAAISVGLEIPLRGVTTSFELHQFVLARVRREALPAGAEDGDESPGEDGPAPPDSPAWPGGTYLRFSMGRAF